MSKKYNFSFEDIVLKGFVLDNCEAQVLTFDNINDIKTILAYDYEDGKYWHDQTCVMEIIFHNYQENIENDRIRICYSYPSDLLAQFSEIMLDSDFFLPSCPVSIKMDLRCGLGQYNYDDAGIKTEDFEDFNCKIKHKKRFYQTNPEMPDD